MDLLDTLFVQTPGTSLHLDGDAIRVVQPGVQGRRLVPMHRYDSMVLWRGVDVSADLLNHCMALGVHVTWITQNGRLFASVTGAEPARPDLRLAQFRAYEDADHRLELAQGFVGGKVWNYRQLLLRAARDATGARQQRLRELAKQHAEALDRIPRSRTLTECLGLEGMAARGYFQHLDALIPGALQGRTRRPALDPVNCYLGAVYGLLRSSVHAAVVHAGLDPWLGYVHGSRPNKPSLVLDLMEEFRALLSDRLVASLFNRDQIRASYHRSLPGGAVELTDAGWKHLLGAWVDWRQREWPHPSLRRHVTAAELPIHQARLLARHLREPAHPYRAWRP